MLYNCALHYWPVTADASVTCVVTSRCVTGARQAGDLAQDGSRGAGGRGAVARAARDATSRTQRAHAVQGESTHRRNRARAEASLANVTSLF